MKQILLIAGGLGLVGLLGVSVWLAAPLFYDTEVNEALPGSDMAGELPALSPAVPPAGEATSGPAPTAPVVLATGTFTGFDELHQAAGTARIVEVNGTHYVRFEDDFTVTNGPDLFVHLGRNGEYAAEANLGRLKGNKGSQNYEIPAGVDLTQYNEVWVWCRAFAVPFGKAVLQ